MKYELYLNSENEVKDLDLSLSNKDCNDNRILKIYDTILNLPNLETSDSVKNQIDKINYLRTSGEFDIKKYLGLD